MDNSIISDIRRYLSVLHKRRGLIATCTAISLLAATLYNYTARPLYQATVLLLLEAGTPNLLGTQPGLDQRRGIAFLNTQFQILRGRALAEAVVAKLRLSSNAEFLAGPIITPWERLQRDVLGRRPEAEPGGSDLSPAVASFRSRLSIEPLPQSSLVNVHFVGYDPVMAQQVANSLAQLYIEQTIRATGSEQSMAKGWLSERLGEQRKAIGQSVEQMSEYERQQGLVNLEERQRLAEQKLNSIHAALVAASTARLGKETLYQQLQGLTPEQLEESPLVLGNSVLQGLRAKLVDQERARARLAETLGEKHPDMLRATVELEDTRRRLREEAQKAFQAVEADYQLAVKQEQTLQADLEPLQQELNELRQKSVEYGLLKREAEADQQVFRSLVGRSRETGLESEIPVSNVRVIERAELPKTPVSPRRARNYQLALTIGLGLGIALTLLLEQMDDSLKTPDDIKEYLKQPFLGMVPDATRGAGQAGASPLILNNPRSPLAEAYRVVRTNLIFSAVQGSSRAVMVSSVNPAEGKSTTVVNLAASLAQNGARVLVVDADLRRPTLHRSFNVASAPGLSDLIVANCTVEQAVRSGVAKGLDVMPCGYVPPNPAELLGSQPLRDLIPSLREAYDWVLIDAPPILTMADAPVLSPVVDGLILVVAAERTARHAVLRSIEQVEGVGGKVLGIVLNRVDLQRNSYYFGRYYGDYYRSYYQDAANRRTDSVATGADPQRRM